MRNNVFGLISMVILPSGEKVRDGTLLFSTEEKANKFLEMVELTNSRPQQEYMKSRNRSHYEYDQEYLVSDSIAESVHKSSSYFVSQIGKHLLKNGDGEVLKITPDAKISNLNFIATDNQPDEKPNVDEDNIIDI